MAKPKQKVLVRISGDLVYSIRVWMDNADRGSQEVERIEGVDVTAPIGKNSFMVSVDPRYEIQDVYLEIIELLNATVPTVFREEI